jgi:hypothetical protein
MKWTTYFACVARTDRCSGNRVWKVCGSLSSASGRDESFVDITNCRSGNGGYCYIGLADQPPRGTGRGRPMAGRSVMQQVRKAQLAVKVIPF